MRIGFDAVSLTKERSGVANYLSHLVRRLVEADVDLQIVLFSPDKICVDYDSFINHPRIRRVALDLPREERKKWTLKYLPSLLKEYAVDLFHQPGGGDMALFHPPCPVVLTVHDLGPWILNTFKNWRKGLRYKICNFIWAQQASRIITGVEMSRKDILSHCYVPASKVVVVPYGAEPVYDGEISPEQADDILRKYRLLGKRYVVNFSGLNFKRRNLDLVLDGFARFHREVSDDVTLVFTGAIANAQGAFDRAQRKIGMLGIRERVVTTGFLAEKTLQVILENAEAVIVTSFYEGFPQSMVEAFAAGTAVIATDRGGVPEIAGEAAVIVDPYDPTGLAEALKRLLGHDVERELYVEKGYERIREFTWQRTAQETLAVYRSVLKV
jgi:glycosyltransferase involved in cell wall biosynthesis